jgi:hypothetical protein
MSVGLLLRHERDASSGLLKEDCRKTERKPHCRKQNTVVETRIEIPAC